MASSEDEEEMVPESVTNYHFVDENEEPVSFSVLPVQWEAGEVPEAGQNQVFLHGIAEDGLEKVYKQVTAWKMELENQVPGVWVLSVDKKWIKLQKPRKSFEDTIRKILITLQCLHYLKRNPESSDKSLWEYIRKVFSHYEIRASEYDLLDHLPLMRKCVDRDESLAKSKLLIKFLDEKPQKRDSFNEVVDHNSDFINDDDDGMDEQNGDANGDESGEEWSDCFDSVCAICDNGGELLCCEGKCLRSFHAIKGSGQDSDCRTLGYSRAYVHAIQNFLCLNCQKNQHQCFACGQLGSSEKSSAAEVFSCVSATCGHFYHPKCVANLLHPENEDEAMELEKKISAGETFTCPVHKCLICKQGEKKEVKELQFATCRRCPRSYHRKCLPRKISFEDIEEENITQRAWDDLIPNRILIYCLKHKIDEDIGTPRRNHIKFPEVPGEKKVRPLDSNKGKVLVKRKAEGLPSTKIVKATQRLSSGAEESTSKKSDKTLSGQTFGSFKKLKTSDTSRKTLEDGTKYFGSEESKISVREERTKAAGLNKELMSGKSMRKDLAGSSIARTVPSASSNLISKASSSVAMVEKKSSLPVIDKEVEKRIMLLVRNSPLYSLTLEEFMKRKEVPSTHAYSARHVDKSITQGKVEGSTEAVRAALKKLEDGCSIEDARAVCEPAILYQIIKWKNKLRVYLAPFLHGMRYTSFGRHFTKVDKLKEIVDKLHWYVQNGDMIVDFCCGANDFSILMKEKLDSTGKKCSFRNYDVIQPKNDFNFEKKDWMKVRPKDLPTGSQLIMGLNPPFGVKASLANKFIDKALEFKPKLLILIVPKETERLDVKEAQYDLIWEDDEKLAGKAFYLPGSVDANDKQMEQWNTKPPPLYLWSRPDWTPKHQTIAKKQGHMSKVFEISDVGKQIDVGRQNDVPTDVPTEQNDVPTKHNDQAEDSPPRHQNDIKMKESSTPSGKKKKSRKRKNSKRAETSRVIEDDRLSDMSISPPSRADSRDNLDGHMPSKTLNTHSEITTDFGGFSRPGSDYGTKYGGVQSSSLTDIDEIERRYAPSSMAATFTGSSHKLSTPGIGGLKYGGGIQETMEEYVPGYVRDGGSDGFGRRAYTDGERSIGIDIHSKIMLYGQQYTDELAQRSRYTLGGAGSGLGLTSALSTPSYGLSGSAIGSSATQRYAPRLDEMNHVMRDPFMPDVPFLGRGSGMGNNADAPGSWAGGLPPDSGGYAARSQHQFHNGSSGWLNE